MFYGEALSRSAYGHLVLEIKAMCSDREFIPQKIGREQNCVADRSCMPQMRFDILGFTVLCLNF